MEVQERPVGEGDVGAKILVILCDTPMTNKQYF